MQRPDPDTPELTSASKRRVLREKKATGGGEGSKTFKFISSDPVGKLSTENRKFVRSHVMRGKNTRPRLTGYPGWTVNTQQPEDGSNSAQDAASHHTSSSSPTEPPWNGRNSYFVTYMNTVVLVPEDIGKWFCPMPITLPHDLALLSFPDTLDSYSRGMIYDFFGTIRESMFPVQWCFQPDTSHLHWLSWLVADKAYFYSSLFTISAVIDIIKGTKTLRGVDSSDLYKHLSHSTARYLRLTVEELQKRLNDPDLQKDDMTIGIIISLATMADIMGDKQAADIHVDGLRQIAQLRGGTGSFPKNNSMLEKLFRVDISHTLKYGGPPKLFLHGMYDEPAMGKIIYDEVGLRGDIIPQPVADLIDGMDPELRDLFTNTRTFVTVADHLMVSKKKLSPEHFPDMLLSINNRLLHISYPGEHQVADEALRLGLVTFQISVFLQMTRLKSRYDMIGAQLRNVILRLPEHTPILVNLKLWLVFVGGVAIFNPEEEWISSITRRLTEGLSWDEVTLVLMQFMWIRGVHGELGKQIYEQTLGVCGATS